jgi:Ni/Co efflux regulator RcnB
VLDLSGVAGGGTSGQSNAEQERPYLAASSGKDWAYKAGWLKARGAGRESERSEVPRKARKTTRWREGALL